MSTSPLVGALVVAALVVGSGCYKDDTSGPGNRKPLAKVLLTDDPFPFDTVETVNVYIVSIAASPQPDTSSPGGQQWVTITEPRRRVDLLTLQQGATTLLGEGEIPADQYRAVRVTIDVDSSDVRFTGGSPAVVDWGGAGQRAIFAFVEAALEVPDSGAEIVVDFDVGRSFAYNQAGDGTFTFIPWIRAINKAATGSIAGTVLGAPDSGTPAPIANATVTAYGQGYDTTYLLSTGRTDAQGHYRLAYLLPATYIVQTNAPRSGGWATAYDSNVVVARGVEATHDVTLAEFHGSVSILGPAAMFLNRTNQLVAVVLNAQYQEEPNPVVDWANLTPSVLSLSDSGRAGKYAWVTGVALGTGQVVATSAGLSDTLTITVVPDSSLSAGAGGRTPRR